MKKYYVLFSLVFSLIIHSTSFAGITGKISGTVKDIKTGAVLPGVNVILEGTLLGTATDLTGHYAVLNIPPGVYNVKATYIGYKTTVISGVRIKIDQTSKANFNLGVEVLEGETVTITAESDKIELDLTASKQTLSGDDINKSWGTDIKEVLSDLPGVNVNGGIRGGFGLNEAYHVDGMDMRDVGSNTNFSAINLSTIQDVEVLTGGFNAEFGRANGAIMNIVTKTASDRIRGTVSYKMRPAGKYHWGRNIYSADGFHRTVMTTPEFWDPNSSWQTEWRDEPHSGYDGNVEPFLSMTPQERADWWKTFSSDDNFSPQINYADRMEWETEATIYGPITDKIRFMLSGRYKEGVTIYPSSLKYNPDMTIQGSLNYQINKSTKLDFTGVYTQFENSGQSKTNFASSEDTHSDDSAWPFVRSPYDRFAYWLWGSYSSSDFNMRAPEYAKFFNVQVKGTHTFSPTTFLEVALQHSQMNYDMHYRDIMKSAYYRDLGFGALPDKYPVTELPWQNAEAIRWAAPGDVWYNSIDTKNTTIKTDLTSQVNRYHQVKMGGLFALQVFDKYLHDHQGSAEDLDGHLTDLGPTKFNPYEGAFYIQDKMEFQGMTINAGVRVDFFNANRTIGANFFDPYMLSDSTIGNTGQIGHISFDPNGNGEGYVGTPTQWAVSPRFGISHPISENTVLHFMYGEFNQRPAWQKIVGPYIVEVALPTAEDGGTSELNLDPDSVLVHYNFYTHRNPNPAITYEKMTQWEVGFEQNISDIISLDVTLYYRDAHNLTSNGLRQGTDGLSVAETASEGNVMYVGVYGDPNVADGRNAGRTIGYFETLVNGAWSQSRGIESTIGTHYKNLSVNVNYTLSFLATGQYHREEVYQYFPENNTYQGANNRDDMTNGIDDDSWQPHNSANLKLAAFTSNNFGPAVFNLHPLANWQISTSTSWSQGQRFTYYMSNVPQEERTIPNNRQWKDKWKTNMNISKNIAVIGDMNAKFSIQIKNLFNQKQLRLPGSSGTATDRINYFEDGQLPVNSLTREPLEWNYYYNQPRQIYLGVTLEF